jgi:hypothetical protein
VLALSRVPIADGSGHDSAGREPAGAVTDGQDQREQSIALMTPFVSRRWARRLELGDEALVRILAPPPEVGYREEVPRALGTRHTTCIIDANAPPSCVLLVSVDANRGIEEG